MAGRSCTSKVSEPGLSTKIEARPVGHQVGDAGADPRVVEARGDAHPPQRLAAEQLRVGS
jgi:hypothetical protein